MKCFFSTTILFPALIGLALFGPVRVAALARHRLLRIAHGDLPGMAKHKRAALFGKDMMHLRQGEKFSDGPDEHFWKLNDDEIVATEPIDHRLSDFKAPSSEDILRSLEEILPIPRALVGGQQVLDQSFSLSFSFSLSYSYPDRSIGGSSIALPSHDEQGTTTLQTTLDELGADYQQEISHDEAAMAGNANDANSMDAAAQIGHNEAMAGSSPNPMPVEVEEPNKEVATSEGVGASSLNPNGSNEASSNTAGGDESIVVSQPNPPGDDKDPADEDHQVTSQAINVDGDDKKMSWSLMSLVSAVAVTLLVAGGLMVYRRHKRLSSGEVSLVSDSSSNGSSDDDDEEEKVEVESDEV